MSYRLCPVDPVPMLVLRSLVICTDYSASGIHMYHCTIGYADSGAPLNSSTVMPQTIIGPFMWSYTLGNPLPYNGTSPMSQ